MEFSEYAFFLDELTKERKLYFVENPAETPISNWVASFLVREHNFLSGRHEFESPVWTDSMH